MPPTPTPVRPGGVLTAKQEWSIDMLTCAAWFVIWLSLHGYNAAPLSKGNFMLRGLATLLSLLKHDELISISQFTSVVFVYHFCGKNLRKAIGFFCVWEAIGFGLMNFTRGRFWMSASGIPN